RGSPARLPRHHAPRAVVIRRPMSNVRDPKKREAPLSKAPTGAAAGNSEAIRIYEAMEQDRKRKLEAKAEACPSSDNLRRRAGFRSGGSGSSGFEVKRL